MDKRGIAMEVELVMSAVLFIVLALVLIVINNLAVVNVRADIEADYAEFACNVDLQNFVNFDAGNGKSYGSLLQNSIAGGNATEFSERTRALLNSILGENKWNMNIYIYDPNSETGTDLLPIFGNISKSNPFKNSRACSTIVPVPCRRLTETLSECLAVAELEVSYD